MSIQSFTRLEGFGSKSEDLYGAHRRRYRTSSPVIQIRFFKTFLESGGINTRECKSKGKEEQMTDILSMKSGLNVFDRAAIQG